MTTNEPTVHLNFTTTCQTCGETVQYADGQRKPHPCPEGPALAIEGCNAATGLADRVEQALDDHELLTGARRRDANPPRLTAMEARALDEAERLRAKVAELTAERDAARDMANTARQETTQALHAFDKARAVIEAATPLLDHVDTIRATWVTLLPRNVGESLLALAASLRAAVDALPTANTDDQPCCGYRCQDNTTGVTA